MRVFATLALLLIAFGPLLLASGSVQAAPARTVSGHALYYGPGMFARVAHNRGMTLRSDVDGYAAVPDCRWIGFVVTARINGGPPERFQVLDCAQTRDYAMQLRTGRVIEVDYATARRNGFVSKGRAPASVLYPGRYSW